MVNYLSVRKTVIVDWNDFVADLYAQFKDSSGIDVVEQFIDFNSLSFVGGLKPVVKPFFKAFKPSTIAQALEYARLQEESLTFVALRNKSSKFTSQSLPATDVRVDKTAKGLCYYCDLPYNREHRCQFKIPQLFSVEIRSECDTGEKDDMVLKLEVQSKPQISVNALAGSQSFQTMRVKGVVNGFEIGTDRFQRAASLDRKMVKFQNQAQVHYLVQWEGFPAFKATWEPAEHYEKMFPDFVIA
uniref:Chromo domain-containing protein n=1 Tax=Chenopodium quinoa TaxID=63459 RepID=A0A803NB79_CHEQI